MKTITFLAIIILCLSSKCLLSQSQPEGSFYVFKADWSTAKNIDEATYFMQMLKEDDTTYVCRYYNKLGPMIKQETFLDENLSIPNGRFLYYNSKGTLDSLGYVVKGRKDDWWVYNIGDTFSMYYDHGKFIEKKEPKKNLITGADGSTRVAADTAEANKEKADTFTTVQVKAKFKNGTDDWVKYIQQNLKTPDRLMNVLDRGRHVVIVMFSINKQGYTSDIILAKSVEWSGDAEVIKLIRKSPRWQPATQNGKTVIYRQKQSLTFEVN